MHIPVLQKEVLKYLAPKPNENFVDATFGQGGHTAAILERNKPNGKVLAIERDTELSKMARPEKRLILVNNCYTNLKEIVARERFGPVAGVLFDLGMSSWHLEKSGRGFTFQKDEPLDMRFTQLNNFASGEIAAEQHLIGLSRAGETTAEKIINNWPEKDIERILREYGQEKFAKRIAKEIVEQREQKPIKTTFRLVDIIRQATPRWYHHKKLSPATKTFQALRIAVNDELNNLKKGLAQAWQVLAKGGRLVTISFHSLEDRICKNFFKESRGEVLIKKPVGPSPKEISLNPRSRSAKLRAAIKHE